MIKELMIQYSWIFSGIGSGFVFYLLGHKRGFNKAINQSMKIGDNSRSIQVGRNMNINKRDKRE